MKTTFTNTNQQNPVFSQESLDAAANLTLQVLPQPKMIWTESMLKVALSQSDETLKDWALDRGALEKALSNFSPND